MSTHSLSHLIPHPRRLVEFGGHEGAHRVAIRAGISVAIPLAVLFSTGHLDLSLYAVFGSFTALYGRAHSYVTRLRMQASAGLALVVAVVIGTAIAVSPARTGLVVPIAAVAAAIATFLADALDWHPPGALFFVFALAACASVPAEPRGIRVALLLASASAILAMVVSTAGFARPGSRRRQPTALAVSFAVAAAKPGELSKVLSVGAAVLVAGAIPTVTGLGHPYWAMVSATAALGAADVTGRIVRAGQRVLGTLIGVALAAALLSVTAAPAALIVLVVLLQAGAELFVGRNYGVTMVFVTPLALIMSQLAHPSLSAALFSDRALETLLGAAVGIGVAVANVLVATRRRPSVS
jgi:hypothetical protein